MIKVTEAAAKKIKEIIARAKNPEVTMLRVAFGGYG